MPAARKRISVLLVDDHLELLELYARQLQRCGPFEVASATDALKARALAERQLFDVLVIDAKLGYRNTEFGGLRLADDLKGRYGTNSIVIMSRFITADWMREYSSDFHFVDKHAADDARSFYRRLANRIKGMWQQQYVLVVMAFRADLTEVYRKRIKPAVESVGLRCVRADEVDHTRHIPSVVFDLVSRSKMVVLVADGLSPNAFYEAGFADAMRKEVVILARERGDLPFDVAQRHAIEYGASEQRLELELKRKLTALRMVSPVGL